MIVATLLLIPVAVLFLALGMVNGSSSLLISSIVVSLLASVALVIGLRQAAARRAAESPAAPVARKSRAGRRDPEFDAPPPAPAVFDEPAAFADDSPPAPVASAGESGTYERAGADGVTEARAAGARDAATHLGDRRAPAEPDAADYADSDSTVDSARVAAEPDEQAWRPAAAEPAEQADEFAEPDDDDPDDEPLPQSVRPADAVLVARFDTEVLVVDGRPRYHMADCPHLVGRLTEPLPANEAVELGFSPCGLCRPVDRLVAAVAHQR